MGMKTADTQTELIDGTSSSTPNSPLEFELINENVVIAAATATATTTTAAGSDNNNDRHLNINSLRDMKDLKCIDDDSASGHRMIFTSDNPETKL
jgi:hypothetical protein